jgi:signal transduction histidine kinase
MTSKLSFNSLRKKILLSIVVFIVLFALITSFIIVLVIDFEMTGRARTDKSAAIQSLSYSLPTLLSSHDYPQVKQVITSSLVFDNIAFVAVYDSGGALIDSETKQGLNAADFQPESHDIMDSGKTIGRFEIGFSQKYIDDLIKWTTGILIFALVGFLLIGGLALFIFMGRSVIRPIELIARTIRQIGPNNLAARTEVRSDDEIGVLAANINHMAGDLEQSYLALQTAHDELEEKVEQLAQAVEDTRMAQESRDIAVLEERNRMAREIHDTLAQGFAGIILQLEAAEQALHQDPADAQQHLDRARGLAKESLNEARRSVWALRPQALEQLPFLQALQQQVETFGQDTGIRANLNQPQNGPALPQEIENALLRICQEALTNVKKHAHAGRVEVNLTFEEKAVKMRIDDDGVGFDQGPISENRFGLISMRERAKLLGGLLEVRSEKGKGTHLLVSMPIESSSFHFSPLEGEIK